MRLRSHAWAHVQVSQNRQSCRSPPLVSKRLLNHIHERIRYLHYSLKTEKAYVYWARFFILWSI